MDEVLAKERKNEASYWGRVPRDILDYLVLPYLQPVVRRMVWDHYLMSNVIEAKDGRLFALADVHRTLHLCLVVPPQNGVNSEWDLKIQVALPPIENPGRLMYQAENDLAYFTSSLEPDLHMYVEIDLTVMDMMSLTTEGPFSASSSPSSIHLTNGYQVHQNGSRTLVLYRNDPAQLSPICSVVIDSSADFSDYSRLFVSYLPLTKYFIFGFRGSKLSYVAH